MKEICDTKSDFVALGQLIIIYDISNDSLSVEILTWTVEIDARVIEFMLHV